MSTKIRLERLSYKLLKIDEWFDQVVLNVAGEPFLNFITSPRYKTSSLSGSEWRQSTVWELNKSGKWEFVHENLHPSMGNGIASFYGEFYQNFPDLLEQPCTDIVFYRKKHILLSMNYSPGFDIPIIHALGHLPYAFEGAFTKQEGVYGWEKEYGTPWWSRCFQPGCAEDAIVTYKLKYVYCSDGAPHAPGRDEHRRFCKRHAIRGDSNMEDCDANHLLIDGERRGAGPLPEDQIPARLHRIVEVR